MTVIGYTYQKLMEATTSLVVGAGSIQDRLRGAAFSLETLSVHLPAFADDDDLEQRFSAVLNRLRATPLSDEAAGQIAYEIWNLYQAAAERFHGGIVGGGR